MYNPFDTIAAIATPPGEGALAIVRLSGESAKTIAEKIFMGKLENRRAVFGRIVDNDGSVIDEVVAIYYPKPKSYTGEDMVELICHGGRVVPDRVLNICCRNGARLAGPGEFTLRAFLGGKMDLTQAEAVNLLIRSNSENSRRLAIENLQGKLQRRLQKIRNELTELLTIIEAQIDFADDEINKLSPQDLLQSLNKICGEISELSRTYDIGRLAEGRVAVAIVGAPNVGKSTLFNALLKSDRAIVTEIPGTTRDYLSEYVNIGGYPVILTDTAGIRDPGGCIEAIGIEKTKQIIEGADLCLFVLDGSRNITDEDLDIAALLPNHQYLLIVNKSDLPQKIDLQRGIIASSKPIVISAHDPKGIPELILAIEHRLINSESRFRDGILLSERQYECSVRAGIGIDEAVNAIKAGESDEITASALHQALESLGEMAGSVSSEELLNRIFQQFCIGK